LQELQLDRGLSLPPLGSPPGTLQHLQLSRRDLVLERDGEKGRTKNKGEMGA